MTTWRHTLLTEWCGCCRAQVKVGELLLEVVTGSRRLVRCAPCGERMFGPPTDVVEDARPASTAVPAGIRHQASLGFTSAAELAHQHHERGSR